MMKKLLLVLGLLLFTAGSVFAYSTPRWMAFPVTVYMPQGTLQADAVKNAFLNWQSNSHSIARFIFKTSNVARKNSNINVEFVKNCEKGEPYEIREVFTMVPYMVKGEAGGFYHHIDLKIATLNADGKQYTKQELYAIALQAVGKSLGISCQEGKDYKGVMLCDGNYNAKSVTNDDYKALFKVYKRSSVVQKKK